MKAEKKELVSLVFEEVSETEMFADYTSGCSGERSDCCTRVCGKVSVGSNEESWGKFLEIQGGVIQY